MARPRDEKSLQQLGYLRWPHLRLRQRYAEVHRRRDRRAGMGQAGWFGEGLIELGGAEAWSRVETMRWSGAYTFNEVSYHLTV